MTTEQDLYLSFGRGIDGAVESQMFGKPCFKVNGKAFMSFFENEMVFKLTDNAHTEALSLDGSKLFDPSGKNRPMREWVQISSINSASWKHFALEAFKYLSRI
jgi:hypothetical protein